MNDSNSIRPFARIVATGRSLPSGVTTNREIEARCDLEEGWIQQRTGIQQRPVVSPDVAVSDLAVDAGKKALDSWQQNTGASGQIGMLILATSTPDYLLPPTAPGVAHRLGLGTIPAFDMAVACSGFVYALNLADAYCRTNHQSVMVIAANILSKRVAETDPATAAIFADGAGATIVVPSDSPGLLAFDLESDGSGADALQVPHGGSKHPIDDTTFENDLHKMKVNNGMAVFRYAVESMSRCGQNILQRSGYTSEDVDFWIPHQANLRIIESVRQRLAIPEEKTAITIDRFANSSAATIPIALDLLLEREQITRGNLLLLTAAAAGLTGGAALIRL